MINMIFFGVYIFVSLVVFSILILSFSQIKKLRIFEQSITLQVARFCIIIIGTIAIFGGYMIFTGEIFPMRDTGNNDFIHL